MKPKRGFIFLVLLITVILSLSLVSAGFWSNFWNKFTGKATDNFCKDSDLDNIYQRGEVTSDLGNFWDACSVKKSGSYYQEPTCSGDSCYVIEYICDGDSPNVNFESCSDCNNGACIKKIQCSESDNGPDYYHLGKTCVGGECKEDICLDNKTLREFYLEKEGILGGGYCSSYTDILNKDYVCENGCIDGVCKKEEAFKCTDSDSGKNYYTKGTACINGKCQSDYCASKNSLIEYYLEEGVCDKYLNIFSQNYNCPNGCSNGACIGGGNETQNTCKETDGGLDYYTKGTATVYQGSQWLRKYTDICFSDTEFPNGLFESYCNGSNLDIKNYNCPNGCSNGACISTECIDSDNGLDYYIKGTATGMENGQIVTSTDGCRYDGKTLAEVYCNGSNLKTEQYLCPNGCSNGACIGGGNQNENVSLKVIIKDEQDNLIGGGASVTLYLKDSPNIIYYHKITDTSSSVTFNIPPGEYWDYALAGGNRIWDGEDCAFSLYENSTQVIKIIPGIGNEKICSYDFYSNICTSKYGACEDTICTSSWPTNQGNPVNIYGGFKSSCSIFEVADEDLDKYIIEAENFCENNPLEYSKSIYNSLTEEQKFKKCKGIFLIEGLGKRAEFMQGYFTPTACCNENPFTCPNPEYFGTCDSGENPIETFNDFAQQLNCGSKELKGIDWMSDEDASQNYCNTVPYPAHVALNILKTGACEEYSIALTTLLRKAGYSKDEVMSVNGIYHMFNYVKFPGESKYYFVDTVGNAPDWSKNWDVSYDFHEEISLGGRRSFVVNSLLKYDHCIMPFRVCYNDLGEVPCPDNSEIYQCENIPEKHKFNLDKCIVYDWWGHKTCSECWYEFKEINNIKGCCVLRGKILGIPWKKTVCENGNIFDYA